MVAVACGGCVWRRCGVEVVNLAQEVSGVCISKVLFSVGHYTIMLSIASERIFSCRT